jgi:GNAT superfamily N-acetyltransferase
MDTGMTIRPARPDDRPTMERICAHTWEWGDYIPEVWEAWLADEQSLLIVGEMEDRVVALSRFRFQASGEIWLEGMRVDPEYRRRGIGRQFLQHSIAFAKERGARVVRLSTSYHNTPVHTMADQAGMVHVGAYQLRAADPQPGGPALDLLSVECADLVRAFLSDSPMMAHTHGLYSVDWAWQELSPAAIDQFLGAGQFAARLEPGGRLAALALLLSQPGERELWIGFIDGEVAALTDLAVAVRGHAARLGAEKVQVMVPGMDWLRDALSEAGYGTGEWEGELWVFERWLEGEAPSPGARSNGGDSGG